MAHSDFRYIAPSELPTYILTLSGITNQALAAKHISQAERLIDAYVGPQQRFYSPELTGKVGAAASGVSLQADVFGQRLRNYWAHGGLYVRVLENPGGPNSVGEQRLVVASNSDTVTLVSAFTDTLAVGARFEIRQLSAFPRWVDRAPLDVPRIPEEVKLATAWQVEYGIRYGSEAYGLSDPSVVTDERGDIQSESYGSGYSVTRDTRRSKDGLGVWVAPKSRAILRRLLNSTGRLVP